MSYPESSNISISDLQTISAALTEVIKGGFGPNGQVTLLSSSTGHVSLSSDGSTILSALHLSHPTAKCIVKGLKSFLSHHGDGYKTLLLYLSSLFSGIKKEIENDLMIYHSDETVARIFLSRSLLSFVTNDLPVVFKEMVEKLSLEMKKELRSQTSEDIIRLVLKTVLNGAAPNHNSDTLANVGAKYLTGGCDSEEDIKNLCVWFDHSVYLIPNQVYATSHASRGIFFTSPLYSKETLLNDISFVCLLCPVDGRQEYDGGNNDILLLNKPESLINHQYSVTQRFISSLKKLNISLIITSSKVQDSFLQLFQASDIAVMACVDDADLEWMCDVCKKSPVTNVKDMIKSTNLIQASVCKVLFARKSFTRVILHGDIRCPNTLFLCAPSEGICQQLKSKMKKALTAVSRLLDSMPGLREQGKSLAVSSHHTNLCANVIKASGYFEVLLCEYLRNYCAKNNSCEIIKMCCSLLQNMLLSVPKALHGKDCKMININQDYRIFSDLLNYKLSSLELLDSSLGLNQQGNLSIERSHIDALEVVSIKMASVYSAISVAISLLRTDKIISVRGRPEENGYNSDPDNT